LAGNGVAEKEDVVRGAREGLEEEAGRGGG
jgi:hypothetical protein